MAEIDVLGPFNYLIGACSLIGIWMGAIQLDRAQLNMTMYDGLNSLVTVPKTPQPSQLATSIPGLEVDECTPCLYWKSSSGEILLLGNVPEEKCCPNRLLPHLSSGGPNVLETQPSTDEMDQNEPTVEIEPKSSSAYYRFLHCVNSYQHEILVMFMSLIMLSRTLKAAARNVHPNIDARVSILKPEAPSTSDPSNDEGSKIAMIAKELSRKLRHQARLLSTSLATKKKRIGAYKKLTHKQNTIIRKLGQKLTREQDKLAYFAGELHVIVDRGLAEWAEQKDRHSKIVMEKDQIIVDQQHDFEDADSMNQTVIEQFQEYRKQHVEKHWEDTKLYKQRMEPMLPASYSEAIDSMIEKDRMLDFAEIAKQNLEIKIDEEKLNSTRLSKQLERRGRKCLHLEHGWPSVGLIRMILSDIEILCEAKAINDEDALVPARPYSICHTGISYKHQGAGTDQIESIWRNRNLMPLKGSPPKAIDTTSTPSTPANIDTLASLTEQRDIDKAIIMSLEDHTKNLEAKLETLRDELVSLKSR